MSRRLTRNDLIAKRYPDAPRGTCRWCGYEILKPDGTVNLRRRWHEPCRNEMWAQGEDMLRCRVWSRERGVCQVCGFDGEAQHPYLELSRAGFVTWKSLWEMDHVVPLCQGGTNEDGNAWTLCQPCHKKKTTREASLRAGKVEGAPPTDPGKAKDWWREWLRRQHADQEHRGQQAGADRRGGQAQAG